MKTHEMKMMLCRGFMDYQCRDIKDEWSEFMVDHQYNIEEEIVNTFLSPFSFSLRLSIIFLAFGIILGAALMIFYYIATKTTTKLKKHKVINTTYGTV